MKPFHAVVLVTFVALALISIFVFASFSGRNQNSVGTVVIWGTLPRDHIEAVLTALSQGGGHAYERVSYREFPESGFIDSLVQAIAAGKGPDLVIFPASEILANGDKIAPISYSTVTRRSFQDSFVQAGEVFLTTDGVLGLPFSIDPLVTYWNRTLYSAAGIARPPQYWDELIAIAPLLSKKTDAGTLTQSAVALGGWGNVTEAKQILLSLVVGLGNRVITRRDDGTIVVSLADRGEAPVPPAESALSYYAGFADSAKPEYSWSRSQPHDRDAFLAGTLATYFGPASDGAALRAANPNLNFDAAAYPMARGGVKAVPATLYALAVPRGTANPLGAARTALAMTAAASERTYAAAAGLPATRRDILATNPANPYDAIFRDAALNAFVFLDPNPVKSDAALARMLDDVLSGRLSISQAVKNGDGTLKALIKMP